MQKLPKEILLTISEKLGISESVKLKMVCKKFNEYIQIDTIYMYTCACNNEDLPLQNQVSEEPANLQNHVLRKHGNLPNLPDINCLKMVVRDFRHNVWKIKRAFYSPQFKLAAVVIWNEMKWAEKYGICKNFLPTNFILKENSKDVDKVREQERNWDVKWCEIHPRIIRYVEKELRLIQKEAWNCPYTDLTSLELIVLEKGKEKEKDKCMVPKLKLKCISDVFDKTVEALKSSLHAFKITI